MKLRDYFKRAREWVSEKVYGGPASYYYPNYATPQWKRDLMGIPPDQMTADEIFFRHVAGDRRKVQSVVDFYLEVARLLRKADHEATPLLVPEAFKKQYS